MRPLTAEHRKFLQPYGPAITRLVAAARKIVLEEAPESIELIYTGPAGKATLTLQ